MFKFESPYFFLLIPILIFLFFRREGKKGILIPSVAKIKKYSVKSKRYFIGRYLIFLATILMTIGLARPQMVTNHKIKKDGIDIVIALDLSRSMLQEDFSPNRLEKSKELLSRFISQRVNDRIGLIIFGGDAYTKIPLTLDNSMVRETIEKIKVDDITSNKQTAIGMGIGVSLNRLKDSTSKSKIVILMTDGENNSGELTPLEATVLAKKLGIKIYTIGIGAYERIDSWFGVMTKVRNRELDENFLMKIASETGGEYFRASDEKSFNEIFDKINALEKTQIEKDEFYQKQELFFSFVKASLLLLLIGLFFEFLLFVRLP